MQYRRMGKWGVKVSEVALGSWLNIGGILDEKTSVDLVRYALDRGINYIDTADVYAHGQAEIVIGKALEPVPRESVFLASKVFFPTGDGPNKRGLSRKHIFEQCHCSLRRMKTEYLDLYLCHRYDSDVPIVETVRAMDDLTRQGKVLYWGVSEWDAAQMEEAVQASDLVGASPPICNECGFNLLRRQFDAEVVSTCGRLGLGLVAFSPLAQGVLTGKYRPDATLPPGSRASDERINMFMVNSDLLSRDRLEFVERLSALAKNLGLTTAQLALAWPLRFSEVSSVICGATTRAQIDENIQASGVSLAQNVCEEIERLLPSSFKT